jgi:hypothetical protein
LRASPQLIHDWYAFKIRDNLPLLINDGIDGRDNPAYDHSTDKFLNSYLHIVTETSADVVDGNVDEIFLSEKTFKPVQYLQPFVLLAFPGSLAQFRKLGFNTFDRWIDESYDQIINDQERFDAALHSAKVFYDQPAEKLSNIMLEMLPVLEHNYYTLHRNVKNLQVDVVTKLIWLMQDAL